MNWNPLTQQYEEKTVCNSTLLTPEQYISQLRIGSDMWFRDQDNSSGRIVLVDNAILRTLVYKADDHSFVKLQSGAEIIKVTASDFVSQWSYDHRA